MPSSSASRDFFGSSSNGFLMLMRLRFAISSTACCMYHDPALGPRPPSNSGLDGSAITLAGSKLHWLPSPWHSSHAPYGLLNENERGSSCGTLVPHSVQASFCE